MRDTPRPIWPRPMRWLAGEQEAHEALGHYLQLWPNTTLKSFGPTIGTAAFNSKMERVLEGLRLAGLPE